VFSEPWAGARRGNTSHSRAREHQCEFLEQSAAGGVGEQSLAAVDGSRHKEHFDDG